MTHLPSQKTLSKYVSSQFINFMYIFILLENGE